MRRGKKILSCSKQSIFGVNIKKKFSLALNYFNETQNIYTSDWKLVVIEHAAIVCKKYWAKFRYAIIAPLIGNRRV